jgi:hypothetical protein
MNLNEDEYSLRFNGLRERWPRGGGRGTWKSGSKFGRQFQVRPNHMKSLPFVSARHPLYGRRTWN